ncbi:hypothetical protein WMY93_034219 [Mugilogobius chulae]|uniref:Uncharacterized protein n=1 Tax=Mugilogobius chulae TaxID=88201 RepID=A0AAW0MQE3_9GOBI
MDMQTLTVLVSVFCLFQTPHSPRILTVLVSVFLSLSDPHSPRLVSRLFVSTLTVLVSVFLSLSDPTVLVSSLGSSCLCFICVYVSFRPSQSSYPHSPRGCVLSVFLSLSDPHSPRVCVLSVFMSLSDPHSPRTLTVLVSVFYLCFCLFQTLTVLVPSQSSWLCFICVSVSFRPSQSSYPHSPRVCVSVSFRPLTVLVSSLGSSWLEQNLSQFLSLLLDFTSRSRSTGQFGQSSGERAQSSAVQLLSLTVAAHASAPDPSVPDAAADPKASSDLSSSHALVCVLLELGNLLLGLGSSAGPLLSDPSTALVDSVISSLLHPSAAVRLAAAWCLRCVAVAMPSQNAVLLDRCSERLTALKSSPEAVSGFGSAVCALVSAAQHHSLGLPQSRGKLNTTAWPAPEQRQAQHHSLGLPQSRGKMVLSLAEDLLRSAAQNSRISSETQVGWSSSFLSLR